MSPECQPASKRYLFCSPRTRTQCGELIPRGPDTCPAQFTHVRLSLSLVLEFSRSCHRGRMQCVPTSSIHPRPPPFTRLGVAGGPSPHRLSADLFLRGAATSKQHLTFCTGAQGSDVNIADGSGHTPLHWAAMVCFPTLPTPPPLYSNQISGT